MQKTKDYYLVTVPTGREDSIVDYLQVWLERNGSSATVTTKTDGSYTTLSLTDKLSWADYRILVAITDAFLLGLEES